MARLTGQRALVTGGAKGIGLAIVERLVAEGADVVAADLDEEAMAAARQRVGATFIRLDVTDAEAVAAAVESQAAANGPFDILVNNAGIDRHGFFTELTPEDWDLLIRVNLFSVFACTRAVLPAMQRAGRGRVICIASEAGRLGSKGSSIYAAAKGAVIAFIRSIARENGRYGITVNAIAPGPTRTPLLESLAAKSGPKMVESMKAMTLMRRLGEPDEIAAAVAFLASEDAGFITGEVLGVSGGMGIGMM